MSKSCASCNAPSPDDASFCIACGTRFPPGIAGTPAGEAAPDAPPAAPTGFSVRWMFLAMGFLLGGMFAVAFVLGIVATLLGADIENENTALLLGAAATILGLFGGAVATGWRSPGVTIREPVVAIILIIVLVNLASGNLAGAFVGWLLPALVAFAGAKLGERMQRRRQG